MCACYDMKWDFFAFYLICKSSNFEHSFLCKGFKMIKK